MTDMRAWKVSNIANDIDKLELHGDESADTLVLGWGSTYGGITQAVNRLNDCLLYTSPSPRDKRQSRMPSSA